jgi:hypothetical protein
MGRFSGEKKLKVGISTERIRNYCMVAGWEEANYPFPLAGGNEGEL